MMDKVYSDLQNGRVWNTMDLDGQVEDIEYMSSTGKLSIVAPGDAIAWRLRNRRWFVSCSGGLAISREGDDHQINILTNHNGQVIRDANGRFYSVVFDKQKVQEIVNGMDPADISAKSIEMIEEHDLIAPVAAVKRIADDERRRLKMRVELLRIKLNREIGDILDTIKSMEDRS